MSKKLNKSFTLVEIVFVAVIVSIGLMTIIYAISSALDNVQSTRQRVIAINLAREGMEGVYQIRDTNWLANSAKKEECRLDMNPFLNEGSDGCSDDAWMASGNYILQRISSGGQETFFLSGGANLLDLDLSNGAQSGDYKYALCFSSGIWSSCPSYDGPVAYFRQIHGEGLFSKNSNNTGGVYLNCTKGTDINCGYSDAKEYRFCSKVAYIGQGKGSVEFCGMLTNFAK